MLGNLGANASSTGNHIGCAPKMILALVSSCLSCCIAVSSLTLCQYSFQKKTGQTQGWYSLPFFSLHVDTTLSRLKVYKQLSIKAAYKYFASYSTPSPFSDLLDWSVTKLTADYICPSCPLLASAHTRALLYLQTVPLDWKFTPELPSSP